MLVIDTNVLLYAADKQSEFHRPCRGLIEQRLDDPAPDFLTWNICYEFLRVSTHHRVFRSPWNSNDAWRFIEAMLASPGMEVLVPTARHADVLSLVLRELPDSRGNFMHDLHTAVLMREHGISRICTRDTDFHRFPFLTVIDPLRT